MSASKAPGIAMVPRGEHDWMNDGPGDVVCRKCLRSAQDVKNGLASIECLGAPPLHTPRSSYEPRVNCHKCKGSMDLVDDVWTCSKCGYSLRRPEDIRNPADILRDGADQFAAKDRLYGSSYKSVGQLMAVLFPSGLTVSDAKSWNRLCILIQIVGKFHRYSANLSTGGHEDSAHDMMVYSAMLKEVTEQEGT